MGSGGTIEVAAVGVVVIDIEGGLPVDVNDELGKDKFSVAGISRLMEGVVQSSHDSHLGSSGNC